MHWVLHIPFCTFWLKSEHIKGSEVNWVVHVLVWNHYRIQVTKGIWITFFNMPRFTWLNGRKFVWMKLAQVSYSLWSQRSKTKYNRNHWLCLIPIPQILMEHLLYESHCTWHLDKTYKISYVLYICMYLFLCVSNDMQNIGSKNMESVHPAL